MKIIVEPVTPHPEGPVRTEMSDRIHPSNLGHILKRHLSRCNSVRVYLADGEVGEDMGQDEVSVEAA